MSNNPFGTLDENIEAAEDRLGGGGALDSDAYGSTITMAYAGESSGGARSLTAHFKLDDGREYRETFYVTSGKEKGQKNYYERDGKKMPLPGFTHANDLALLSTGQSLSQQEIEDRVVKLYDFDQKAEVPTKVQAVVSMIGKKVRLGILKIEENKSKRNDSTGQYDPVANDDGTPAIRQINNLDKVFHYDTNKTVSEFTARLETAEFYDKWVEKNKGKVVNKVKPLSGNAGKSGMPGASGGSSKPTTSLF